MNRALESDTDAGLRRPLTRIAFGAGQTTVVSGTDSAVNASAELIGATEIAEEFFRHDPPAPLELENAIDAVEADVSRAQRIVARGSVLSADDPTARDIARAAGMPDAGATNLPLDAVELLFQRLASASLGNTAARRGVPSGNTFVAAVLILREFMHHLGFASITIEPDASAAPQAAVRRPRQVEA